MTERLTLNVTTPSHLLYQKEKTTQVGRVGRVTSIAGIHQMQFFYHKKWINGYKTFLKILITTITITMTKYL